VSLLACPECRQRVSSLAAACPHCGCPFVTLVPRKRGRGVLGLLVVFGIILLIIGVKGVASTNSAAMSAIGIVGSTTGVVGWALWRAASPHQLATPHGKRSTAGIGCGTLMVIGIIGAAISRPGSESTRATSPRALRPALPAPPQHTAQPPAAVPPDGTRERLQTSPAGRGESDPNDRILSAAIGSVVLLAEEIHPHPRHPLIRQHLAISGHPAADDLRTFLRERARELGARADKFGIFVYESRAHYESGAAQWMAMASKTNRETAVSISVQEHHLPTKQPKSDPSGLDEETRRQIFRELVEAERRADEIAGVDSTRYDALCEQPPPIGVMCAHTP
jgi:hypothetical protein